MENLIKSQETKTQSLPSRPILKQPVYSPLKKLGAISDKCIRCETTVYPVERVQVGRSQYFHTKCFTCMVCHVKLNIKNFNSFKDNDKLEVYCQRHLPKYPGDLAGEEYLGEVGIREAMNLYRMGEPMFQSAFDLSTPSIHNRKLRKFMEKRNSYYKHIGESLVHTGRSAKSEASTLIQTPSEEF